MYIIVKGESIPIFKTRNTWITDIDGFSKIITNEIIDTAKDKAKEISKKVIDYTESKAEDFLESASIAIVDYIDSKVDLLVDKHFLILKILLKKGHILLRIFLMILRQV